MRLLRCISLVSLLVASSALAQNAKVSTLIPVTTPLTGSELFYVVQGGVSKNMTFSQLSASLLPLNNTWTGTNLWTPPSPTWSSYTTQYQPIVFNLGGLPLASTVGGFTPGGYTSGGQTTAVLAALDTPSTDQALLQPGSVSGNINIALAGNCRSASTVKGCVGVFGGGMPNANGVSNWGANFVATNYPYMSGTSPGFNAGLVVGAEIDVYLNPPTTGVLTSKAVELLMYTALGSGATLPTGGLYGIEIGGTGSSTIGLVCALCIDGGPNSQAIAIGQAGVGNGFNSQLIAFNATNSGGTVLRTTMYADQSGNIDFAPTANAGVLVQGNGNTGLLLNKSTSGSNAALYGQTAGLLRWAQYMGNSTAESGSNAGSDFQLCRANDAGSLIDCPLTILRTAGVLQLNSSSFTANGTTALSLTSVGPSGAHATVQEWMTVQDTGGTTRYIPAF